MICSHSLSSYQKQECIPVGCVPPAHWLYLILSAGECMHATHAPLPHMPTLPHCHTCPHHACPLPCMPPCHACHPPHTPFPATHAPATQDPSTMHVPLPHIPPPWTDRHLWKHNLRKLRLRAVMMKCYTKIDKKGSNKRQHLQINTDKSGFVFNQIRK